MGKLKNKLNLKSLTIGITFGIAITALTPVFATVEQYILTKVKYPIVVNGAEYVNEELPALNYKGNTFIPLRTVGNILGTKVNWNEELRRVEIGEIGENVEESETTEITIIQNESLKGVLSQNQLKNIIPSLFIDNLNKYKNVSFISLEEATKDSDLVFKFDNHFNIDAYKTKESINNNEEAVLVSIPYVIYKDEIFIRKNYAETFIK